jgi:hypothetical protein
MEKASGNIHTLPCLSFSLNKTKKDEEGEELQENGYLFQ